MGIGGNHPHTGFLGLANLAVEGAGTVLAFKAAEGAAAVLAAFVADVWASRAKRRLAPKIWQRDSAVYNKHILHQLGDRPIAHLNDAEVLVEWQDALEAAGVGAPTVIKAMTILSSILRARGRSAAPGDRGHGQRRGFAG